MVDQDYAETSPLLPNTMGQEASADVRRTSGEAYSDIDVQTAVSAEDDPTMACVLL